VGGKNVHRKAQARQTRRVATLYLRRRGMVVRVVLQGKKRGAQDAVPPAKKKEKKKAAPVLPRFIYLFIYCLD
jgi:hypothetical protein